MKCLLIFLPVLLGEKLRFKKLEPKEPEIFKGPLSEGCQSEAYPSERVLYEPKTYQINLDLDPSERWTAIGKDYAEHVQALLKVVIGVVNKIDDRLVPFVLKNLPKLAESLPENYVAEMTGLAKAAEVDFGEIVLYNIFYEVFSACTSIIAKGDNGELLHARNLDFGLFVGWDFQNMTWPLSEALRPAVVNMEFQKDNKTLYTSAGFVGYIGVFTGVKPNAFSFSANERFSLDGGYVGIIEWILGKHDAAWLGFYSRDIFEQCDDYACAKASMEKTEMVSPVYFILADGKSQNDGCVITREREKVHATVNLNQEKDQTKSGSWFLLQTNYDPDKSPPFFDDRRNPGIKCMNKMGEKSSISKGGMFDVLSTKPNLNMLTVYTSLMNLKTGTIETYIRECPFPCSPW